MSGTSSQLERALGAKRKIAVVSNTGWAMYRYGSGLLRMLSEQGWEVVAAADWRDGYEDEIRALNVKTAFIPARCSGVSPLRDLWTLLAMLRFYRALRPDVAHHFHTKPVIYGSIAARAVGVPRIVNSITGLGILFTPNLRWLCTLASPLYRLALGGQVVSIFENQENRQQLIAEGFTHVDRTLVVPGVGLDTESLAPDPAIKPADRNIVVMAARMLWSKGVAEFVLAAERLKPRFPDIRFILAGGVQNSHASKNPDFVDVDWIRAAVARGKVEWLGHQPPKVVEALFRRAAAVVLPSSYPEGVPRCLIEGAAAGAPLVTTDLPGCRHITKHGVNGFLCRPNSVDDLEAALGKLLSSPDLVGAMGAQGRKIAVDEYDQRRMLSALIDVYEGLSPPLLEK